MDCQAGLHGRVAVAPKRDNTVNKVRLFLRNRQRVPSKLVWRSWHFEERTTANETSRNLFVGAVRDRRADSISPCAAIRGTRRCERCAAELLRVQTQRMPLRRILAGWQRSRNSLSREFVAEAGLISDFLGHALTFHRQPRMARLSASCIAS